MEICCINCTYYILQILINFTAYDVVDLEDVEDDLLGGPVSEFEKIPQARCVGREDPDMIPDLPIVNDDEYGEKIKRVD